MHHVHISTGFMFVCLLFVVAVIAIFAWLSWSKRQALLRNLQIQKEHEERMERIRRSRDNEIVQRVTADTNRVTPRSPGFGMMSSPSARPRQVVQPVSRAPDWNGSAPVAPVVVNAGSGRSSGSDFVEGALLGGIAGSMMGGREHDTVIEREVSTPSPAPDPFAGSGSDAGSSGGGFDYSSGGGDSGGNFDCGSSGGFDSGGCDF